MNDAAIPAADARISRLTRWSWGLGSFGTITYINTVTTLVLVYLTTIVKIDPLLAGALVTGARVFDAFTDPLMGYITDRTRTRIGRRRPYLLLGAIICGVALPLVYNIPLDIDQSTRLTLVVASLLVYSVGFTVFNVPYLTMPVEMTNDPQERVSIMSSRVLFMTLGSFVGAAFAPALLKRLGTDAEGYGQMGIIFGVVVFVAMLFTFLGTSSARTRDFVAPHVSIREQWRTALQNRPFLILMGVKVLQFIGIAANSSTLAYFVTTVMKRDFDFMMIYGVAVGISTLVSLAVWRKLARRMAKRTGFIIGVIGYVVLTLTWVFSGESEPTWLFILRPIVMGMFSSAVLLFGQVVWIDAVDYDYRRTGLRREGTFTSVYVFIERLGYSLAPLMLGALLQGMGFDKNLPLEAQSESAELAVMIAMVGIPAITFGLSLILLTFYDLTDEKLAATIPPTLKPRP